MTGTPRDLFAGRGARLGIAAAAVSVALAAAWLLLGGDRPDFGRPAAVVMDPRLQHPGDIVRFKGRYVATEINNDRLAVFDDLSLDNLEYFDPRIIGREFRSPHFLAVTPRDTLLVSNGWGDSIVEIADLDGGGWKEFKGIDRRFHAPHGICVDESGWIYVGDSLNSRLVRFRDMEGSGWQVFADEDRRVSYIRELVCRDGAVWASNSYENREGLNPGTGSNVLKITDFESGESQVAFSFPDTNITGVMPINDHEVLVGQWSVKRRLALADIRDQSATSFARLDPGTPYGTFRDHDRRRVLVSHIGELSGDGGNVGGITVYPW